jgi:hypothetical protein
LPCATRRKVLPLTHVPVPAPLSRGSEHARQWRASITEVDSTLGRLPVVAIDTALVLKAVEPIWRRAQVTGRRTLQRVEVVLDWAKANEARSGDNPARWKGHFEHLLKDDHQVKNHPALPDTELAAFLGELRQCKGTSFRALEFANRAVIARRNREFDPSIPEKDKPLLRLKRERELSVRRPALDDVLLSRSQAARRCCRTAG